MKNVNINATLISLFLLAISTFAFCIGGYIWETSIEWYIKAMSLPMWLITLMGLIVIIAIIKQRKEVK